jgi:hypothetical protein
MNWNDRVIAYLQTPEGQLALAAAEARLPLALRRFKDHVIVACLADHLEFGPRLNIIDCRAVATAIYDPPDRDWPAPASKLPQ